MSVPTGFDIKQAHVISDWNHNRPLLGGRLDPQGRYLFCGSEGPLVVRFRIEDGAITLLSGGHPTWVRTAVCTPDGALAISGDCAGKLTWWEAAADAPQPIRTIDAHRGWIRALACSPDGKYLASGGNDGLVRLWNPADGTLLRELKRHERDVYSVAFHPESSILLSGDLLGVIRQWDPETGAEVRTFDAKVLSSDNTAGQGVAYGGVRCLSVSPDGKKLVAGGLHKATNPLAAVAEPTVLLFDWESQKLERQFITEGIPSGCVERIVWLADGSLAAASGGNSGGFLLFWKIDTDKDVHRVALPNIRDLDLHPDGLRLVTSHHDTHARLIRLAADPPAATG